MTIPFPWRASWRSFTPPIALSPRDRRTLLFGISAISLIVVAGKGIPAWRNWERRVRADAADWRVQAERAERLAHVRSTLRDSLVKRSGRWHAFQAALMEGETPATASANFTTLVSTTATNADVRLGSIDVHVDSVRSALTHVRIHTEILGDVTGLTAFLSDLESGPTLVTVEAMTITPSDPQALPDRPEQLRVELSLLGEAALPTGPVSRTAVTDASLGSVIPHVEVLPATFFVADSVLDSLSGVVIDHDAFRLDRKAANVPYELNPTPVAPPSSVPSAPQKPTITLAGTVGGPPWTAMLLIPDKGNVSARTGDTVWRSPLAVIRSVTRDSAVLRWADTTWHLGLHRSWQ